MTFIQKYFKFWFEKEPIPPNKPLSLLDESKLKPFEVVEKHQIKDKDILDSLGTEEYIQWAIKDSRDEAVNTTKLVTVFITYYEKPDAVPHVPEECYTGGGYQKTSSEEIIFNVEDIRKPNWQTRKIPGRIVMFEKAGTGLSDSGFPVLYFFNVNGEYVNTRTEARIILGKNIRGRYSYFSKVEIVFNKTKASGNEEAVRMTEKILSVLLPLLEEEHWPTKEQLKGTK